MSAGQILSINDLEFKVGPCDRCGGTASETEALRALEVWAEWFGEKPSCAVCGGTFRMVRVVLAHRTTGRDPGVTAWKVLFVIFTDCLGLTGLVGPAVRVHGSCAPKALPHADWGDVDCVSHTEHGRSWAPWDDPKDKERLCAR